jgi:hypothetical protein
MVVRVASALSVLVVVVWFLLVRSVDGGPTAQTLTLGFVTLYAIAAIVLIWLGVGMTRLVRASLKARREVFGTASSDGPTPTS